MNIFLLGIGGVGMEALACYLKKVGHQVYGWDDYTDSDKNRRLNCHNFILSNRLPEGCRTLIYSSAIPPNHPLLQEAIRQQWTVMKRGEFLARLLKDKHVVAVAGSHGKSSTTAYLIHFCKNHGIPISYLLGAAYQREQYPMGDYNPEAEWTILELDESDGTIDHFSPTATLILNDDWDHSTHYPTAEAYTASLLHLCERTRQWILLSSTIRWSCETAVSIYRLGIDFTLKTSGAQTCIAFEKDGAQASYDTRTVFSLSNLGMALSAFYLIAKTFPNNVAIQSFPGIKRRQEILLKTENLLIVSDYAHHPNELKTYLQFAKGHGEHWVAFEPHRSSRVKQFYTDFINIFKTIPHLFLANIYQAFENEPPLLRDDLLKHLPAAKRFEELSIEEVVASQVPHKLVSFIGAGKMNQYARAWIERLILFWKEQLEGSVHDVIATHVSLTHKTTFVMGGECLFLYAPKTAADLSHLLQCANRWGLPWYILGKGSNVLISQRRFNGLVIQLSAPLWQAIETIDAVRFRVGAGCVLNTMLNYFQQKGIGGFEFLDGIPGTVGGALRMNAGTHGIWDFVESIHLIDPQGNIKTLSRDEVHFTYRNCSSLEKCIALSIVVVGRREDPSCIKERRDEFRTRRKMNQPRGRSLGCFFKNTIDGSTGKLLDQLGVKNMKVGGAYVSEKHANFILNDGTAKFDQVIELMRQIVSLTKQKTNLILEPEVKILGDKWENYL